MRNSAILVFFIAVACFSTAEAHAMLDHASPAVGGTVATSPGQVTLYFTQQLEPKFSGAEVRNSSGARVDHGKSISGNVMRLSVGTLAPGAYSVTWHVLSVDTLFDGTLPSDAGAKNVQMASSEGREKSSVARPSEQGVARHLSVGSFGLGNRPPFRTPDAAACYRFVLARATYSR